MQRRKAIIHIGTSKTGTTTIQHFLDKNRESLKNQGVYVPSIDSVPSINNNGHHKLCAATYIANEWESWTTLFSFLGHYYYMFHAKADLHCGENMGKSLTPRDQDNLWEQYRREIEANCHKEEVIVFSTEMFSLFTEKEIEKFKGVVNSLFDDVTVIVYLRRQPEYLASFYYSFAIAGSTWNIFDYLNMPDDRSILAYHQIVKRWSIFGKNKIKIRIFDKQAFCKNDLLSDFAATAGFDITGLKRVKNQNETGMDSAETEFLRLLNSHIPVLLDPWTPNPERGRLLKTFLTHCQKKGCEKKFSYHFNRSEARRILEQYQEGNDWIAEEYLGCEKLFNEDVSMYPEEVASSHGLTLEKCTEITACLCKEFNAENHVHPQIVKGILLPRWFGLFLACFIPKKKNRQHFRAKYVKTKTK